MSDAHNYESFYAVINRWKTVETAARDFGASHAQVRNWKSRDSIPGEWWLAVARAGAARGYQGINLLTLAKIAESQRLRDKGRNHEEG
jgi:hypothetical protein